MTTISMRHSLSLPPARTIINLMLGGFAGLGFWEVFSAVPTAWFADFPLEPPELVKALFLHQLGLALPSSAAKLLHFTTGFLLYPLGYYGWTRWVKSFGMPVDGWVWGTITYLIALAILAPLAGLPFLLNDVPRLSFMSLVGHAVYGYLSAYVFEYLEAAEEVEVPVETA